MAEEKESRREPAPARRLPHYRQTTDFTCGPASLMMAMKALAPQTKIDRGLELQLWREANTIFMGPSGGHGGCSALGLALAVRRRGFKAEVHVNHRGVLLGVRTKSKERAEVMRVLQARDLAEAKATGVRVRYDSLDITDLEKKVRAGYIPIVLNSMRYLHDDPTAHWFVVTGFDADNVYVNDPWVSLRKGKTARDMTGAAIPRRMFDKVTSYGSRRERAVVLVGH
jgi:predicted double-glycine peptidase